MRRAAPPAAGAAVLFVSVPTGIGGSTRSLANVLRSLDGDASGSWPARRPAGSSDS